MRLLYAIVDEVVKCWVSHTLGALGLVISVTEFCDILCLGVRCMVWCVVM
jgi:hypothetical protein